MTAQRTALLDFAVEQIEVVQLDIARAPDGLLAGHDLMSPYIWEAEGRLRLLVRVLKNPLGPTDPTGIIYKGESDDGLFFAMDREPVIAPGPDEVDASGVEDPTVVIGDEPHLMVFYTGVDASGVEDPTVVIGDEPHLMVFYTGVDAKREQGSLLVATGPDLKHLTKDKVLLKAPEGEGNIKEATVVQGADGRYRMFYEYAKDRASRIGAAVADNLMGPWEVIEDPFTVREKRWDARQATTAALTE